MRRQSRKLQFLTANFSTGKVRREILGGRKYLVAPLTLIVPGVLDGSRGPLFYPPDEISKSLAAWNNVPIVVYHPKSDGSHVSAKDPKVLDEQGIGMVLKANVAKLNGSTGKLRAEGWFDEERTRTVDRRIYDALLRGDRMEISTGLYTDNEPAENGSTHRGKPYSYIARNYRPDHLAILPDQTGACSVKDGCGMNVNQGHGGAHAGHGGAHGGEIEDDVLHAINHRDPKVAKQQLRDFLKGKSAAEAYKAASFLKDRASRQPEARAKVRLNSLMKVASDAALRATAKERSEIIDNLDLNSLEPGDRWERIASGDGFKFKVTRSKVKKLISNRRTNMAKRLNSEKRQEIINNLLACNGCGWSEDDRDTLNAMKDEKLAAMEEYRKSAETKNEQLKGLEPVVNAVREAAGKKSLTVNEMPAFIKEKMKDKEMPCEEGDEECMEKNKKAKAAKAGHVHNELTEEQVLNALTPEMREDLAFARQEKARQKQELVEKLLVNMTGDNAQRTAQREKLLKYSLDELRTVIQPLVPQPPQRVANYAGAAAPTGNAQRKEVPPMPMPHEYAEADKKS